MLQSQAAELKQQGALEAARDPNSSVTADHAEQMMVRETINAGHQAYQFDPNASPEEKAAQARAQLPPGFHSEKKPNAVGIVTDISNGKPDEYELPPPSKAGALPLSPSKLPNGTSEGTNGHISAEENARWVQRVGWAPRFGTGAFPEDDDDDDIQDHQTWVETRLDDKFFGDWYHNTGVIVFACLSSYLVAELGGGLAWIFIIMAVCATYYRTSIRRVRRNFRDDVNREMAKAKIETDVESLEWINSFLVKFWPIYEPVLCETVISAVDQVLSTATPAFLDSLRLKSFILGSKPPRMEHVKTYPKAEDDIVLMDWKFSFTPNDTADLTARQIKNKINPKVVLEVRIGKAMISKGLDIIVEDVAFSGLMRVKVKLQIPFPHVERIEVCFLEKPEIDYVCKPLGGDTFGFDIGFLPGLQSFIQSQIHANIGPIMYAPNVFPIEVAKMLAGNAVDQAIGVLAVTLHGAQGLKNPDKFSGSPDPYVVLSLNSRDALAKTKIVKENANPRWNESKYVIITSYTDNLTLQLFDFNEYRKDKELGTATFALDRLQKEAEHENQQLEVMSNGRARGIVSADIRFFPVLTGRQLDDGKLEAAPESNTGIVKFTIEQAKDLDGTKSLVGQTNPFAVLLLNGQEVHRSQKMKRTNNPIWTNGSKEMLITDRRSARLGLVIKDERELIGDVVLGTYQIKVDDMLQLMEKGQEWYNLAGAKSGRAKLTLQWKPVALTGILGGSGGYVTPIGVMRLHFQGAKDLKNVETMGKSDPYVRILLSGVEKGRTVTFQNNLNPEWDEVLYVPMHSTREKLTFEVMDEENMGKDRSLGLVELAAADFISQSDTGEYVVHEERKPRADPLRMHGKGAPKGTLNYTAAFYPCLNVADPEEEERGREAVGEILAPPEEKDVSAATGSVANKEADPVDVANKEKAKISKTDASLTKQLVQGEEEQEDLDVDKKPPQIRVTREQLVNYESGLIVFKLIEGDLSHSNCNLEVVMDDMRFPSYVSSKAKTRHVQFDETGDAMVREIDVSQITIRLREKSDRKGDSGEDRTLAKLSGDTLGTLKQCLHTPTVLSLRDSDGGISKIKVSLRYIPIKMKLDPRESINNSGELRVDVLDGKDLPAADRNGFSDPFCRFQLNRREVYKTKIQKKTLNPVWTENFTAMVPSRIAAQFKVAVMDWDRAGEDDLLGEAEIDLKLLEPLTAREYILPLQGGSGSIRLRLQFKPNYVTRSRQGSSTFSGTFATPTKIVTGVASAPIKGVGIVGGGVAKGATFLTKGFRSKKGRDDDGISGSINRTENSTGTNGLVEASAVAPSSEPVVTAQLSQTPVQATTPEPSNSHQRSRSFGAASIHSVNGVGGVGGGLSPEAGLASISVLSASGFPASAHVQVRIRLLSPRGAKEMLKTRASKSSSAQVVWDNEMVRMTCAPDTQFQVQVKDKPTFGRDEDLGEALFFLDDTPTGSEKSVTVGSGQVVLRSSFTPVESERNGGGATSSASNSPNPKGAAGNRRSFLHRKNERGERAGTPT